jgi:hypothetical protein
MWLIDFYPFNFFPIIFYLLYESFLCSFAKLTPNVIGVHFQMS